MNSQTLRPIYVFGTSLLLFTGSVVLPQAAAKGASITTDGPVLLAQASGQSSNPLPPEVLEWQRQVETLYQQGKYQEAVQIQEKELAWTEKHLGPEDLVTVTSLMNLAELQQRQGVYDKAEPLYIRALAATEKAMGPNHLRIPVILNSLGRLYVKQRAYAKAEPLILRALAITEKSLGPDHLGTTDSLHNLAELYVSQRANDKAVPLLLRAVAITEKSLGPDHLANFGNLLILAKLYLDSSSHAKAEPILKRVVAITEKSRGRDHTDTAGILQTLAGFYIRQGVFANAELLLRRALAIREKALGPDHPDTAKSLSSLAELYANQGAYAKAKLLILRALAIREKALGPDHPDTAKSLADLAVLYRQQGVVAKAKPLLLRALAIREKALGPDHPDTAGSLYDLAELYMDQGLYAKAEPLYLRTLGIYNPTDNLFEVTNIFNSLAWLYEQKQYSNPIAQKRLGALEFASISETLLRLAVEIKEDRLPPDHPSTAKSLNEFAVFHLRRGAYAKAESLQRRSLGIQSRFLQGQLPLLPQAARQAQVRALGDAWQLAFSGAERSASAAELALFSRLNRYGLLLELEQRQAQLGRSLGAPLKLSKEIQALTAQLADAATTAAERQELGKRREELERVFYRLLPSLKPRLVEPAQVARFLPAGAVLVEFQRYFPFDWRQKPGQQWGPSHYLALVLSPGGITRAVDLGPARKIDRLIAQALAVSQASGGDPTDLWKQVNRKVFPAPLLQLLAGANQWILAPDGELSRIPFAALPSPRDPQRRLTDTVAVRLISSGRTLLPQSPSTASAATRPLVLADPDFGAAPSNTRGWKRLPATAKEGRVISDLVKAELFQQAAATTAVLTRAKRPRLVHVASHGYYANASKAAAQAVTPPVGGSRSAIAGLPSSREDAMLNSGIVLAGANRSLRPDRAPATPSTGSENSNDDGYLTAKEAAQLQLEGTQLVVLSACDTASGEQQSGEGLFGLQRALSVAGARTTLLSLWKVDDEATAYFMQRYYTLLKQGKGRMEALLAVQQEFRDKPQRTEWEDYRYWAAWQLVGESGPIPGI